ATRPPEVWPMRRALLAVAVLAIAAVAVYWFGLRGSATPTAEAKPTEAVAQIGEGKSAVLVGADGRLLGSASASTLTAAKKSKGKQKGKAAEGATKQAQATAHLPVLPLKQPPKNGRQVR